MANTTECMEKIEALRAYLINEEGFSAEEVEEISETQWHSFEVCGREYEVLTFEESTDAAVEKIHETLWAFNPRFVLEHTEFYKASSAYDDFAFVEALELIQAKLCEGANPIVRALIVDLEEFARDAIECDGVGHFLASYDGEEIELELGKFYAYRVN